jgi:hypothetical protein
MYQSITYQKLVIDILLKYYSFNFYDILVVIVTFTKKIINRLDIH